MGYTIETHKVWKYRTHFTDNINKFLNIYWTAQFPNNSIVVQVFRTYNASFTLQQQLDELTHEDDPVQAKMLRSDTSV